MPAGRMAAEMHVRSIDTEIARFACDELQCAADLRGNAVKRDRRAEIVVDVGDCKAGAQHAFGEMRVESLVEHLPEARHG